MVSIRIDSVSGTTPIDVYVADYYGNNRNYLGQLTGLTTPVNFNLPPEFEGAPEAMIILSASNTCEKFKIVTCVPFD